MNIVIVDSYAERPFGWSYQSVGSCIVKNKYHKYADVTFTSPQILHCTLTGVAHDTIESACELQAHGPDKLIIA